MSFIPQREHQVSVPFALAEGPAYRVQKDRFSVCDILPCHSLYNDISKQRCLRDDKNRSHGSSHTANVCGRSLTMFLGGICGLMQGLSVPSRGLCSKWLRANPAGPLTSLLRGLHPRPRGVLLSNLLWRILGLFAALLWLGCILSIKWSKALHSAFPLSHPA